MPNAALNPSTRATAIDQLRDAEVDVLVIGGGVTGAGAALDAATRGLKVALVERRDWAAGTSSRSGSSSTAACGTWSSSTSGWCAKP